MSEVDLAIERRCQHQRATAITKYRSQPVARLDQTLDEDDVAGVDLDAHGELTGGRLARRHHELLPLRLSYSWPHHHRRTHLLRISCRDPELDASNLRSATLSTVGRTRAPVDETVERFYFVAISPWSCAAVVEDDEPHDLDHESEKLVDDEALGVDGDAELDTDDIDIDESSDLSDESADKLDIGGMDVQEADVAMDIPSGNASLYQTSHRPTFPD